MAKVTGSSKTMQFSVSEISKLTSTWSPEVLLFGVPWQVDIRKCENGTQKSLATYLYCTNKDESSSWTAVACATIKLLSFSDDQQTVEHLLRPYVYDHLHHNIGTPELIEWNDLLNVDKKYVKDDTIRLEIKIEAEDPNSLSRSILKFESCDCGNYQATLQLTITNFSNLMAVRSPKVMIRDMPWYIVVYKNAAQLCFLLQRSPHCANVPYQVTMTVKLFSSDITHPIEKSDTAIMLVQSMMIFPLENLVSWEELSKPEHGIVNENSIKIKIDLTLAKPEGDVPIATTSNAAKRRRFECPICLEDMDDRDMSTTPCGHLFCTACITAAVRSRRVCPNCQKRVQLNRLRPVFI